MHTTARLTPHADLAGGPEGAATVADLVNAAARALANGAAERGGPVPAASPAEVAAGVRSALAAPRDAGPADALARLTRVLAAGAADPADPRCAAHLHCPPLAVAVAADTVAAALNQSLDSWDQSPSATAMEPLVIAELAELVGYDPRAAGGVMTSGGTESNLTGLLLARDHAMRAHVAADAGRQGVAPAAGRLRVLCGSVAHFSVQRSAALLGLGEEAVVAVEVDEGHRMCPEALEAALASLRADGLIPAAVVATAGTTDLGGIDPLRRIAAIARAERVWLHVDAAYGGGALFSSRLRGLLDGLSGADSVGLDLHKFGWQPVAAGIFLTRDSSLFEPLSRTVAYLNPDDDEAAGYPSLLGYSLRTTRRADVFKIAVTLRALGHSGLGGLVDSCHDLARYAAERIGAEPRLRLAAAPVLTTVVFRYEPEAGANGSAGHAPRLADTADTSDAVNAGLRRRLLAEGRAVIGRTELDGQVWLKLTLLNPNAAAHDVDALLAEVVAAGDAEAAIAPQGPPLVGAGTGEPAAEAAR